MKPWSSKITSSTPRRKYLTTQVSASQSLSTDSSSPPLPNSTWDCSVWSWLAMQVFPCLWITVISPLHTCLLLFKATALLEVISRAAILSKCLAFHLKKGLSKADLCQDSDDWFCRSSKDLTQGGTVSYDSWRCHWSCGEAAGREDALPGCHQLELVIKSAFSLVNAVYVHLMLDLWTGLAAPSGNVNNWFERSN